MKKINLRSYITQAGICSRRKAHELIKQGEITVNNKVILEPSFELDNNKKNIIKYNNKIINIEPKVYILLNKPKNCLSTVKDTKDRKTVIDLIKSEIKSRVYPIGRLDKDTTGLLILTNDGDLSQKLAHPKYNVTKEYFAKLDKNLLAKDLKKLKSGVNLEDGIMRVDKISFKTKNLENKVYLEIHSGKKRVVRRLFMALGYKVLELDRVKYDFLTKYKLALGTWRYLSDIEIKNLKNN